MSDNRDVAVGFSLVGTHPRLAGGGRGGLSARMGTPVA